MLIFRDLKKCNILTFSRFDVTLRYVAFTGPARLFEQGILRDVYSQSGINRRDWFYYTDEYFNAGSCRYKLQLKRILPAML